MTGRSDNPKAAYPFEWGAATHIGIVRRRNEDAYVVEPELGLLLAIDGMGGHLAGDIAAGSIARGLPAALAEQFESMKMRLTRAVCRRLRGLLADQNRQVFLQGLTRRGAQGMGATLAMVLLLGGRAYVANVGDSRVYRWRAGRLVQLSRDHSVVSELVERGDLEPSAALYHHMRGVVTQHIGMLDEPEPHVRTYALKPGDRFLLCTDGLTDQVPDAAIETILANGTDCQQTCDLLVEDANARGGIDNVTVVLAHWTGLRQ